VVNGFRETIFKERSSGISHVNVIMNLFELFIQKSLSLILPKLLIINKADRYSHI
jgi:hypothetical protein